jgi:hypothetical protein
MDINKTAELYVKMKDSECQCESDYADNIILPSLRKNNWDVVPDGKNFKLVSLREI